MPAEWADYVRTGQAPPIGGEDQSRSAIEQVATGHLLRASHTAATAWGVIEAAHPGAFTKARERGRAWWTTQVWNRAVQADTTWRDMHNDTTAVPVAVAAAVSAARARLEAAVWAAAPRRRAALLRVGDVLLNRAARQGTTRVPCPERDLVQDTGITARQTIRACLHQLHDAGVLTLHESFDPAQRENSSHEISLEKPFSLEGVSETYPPALDTPFEASGPPTPLPRPAYALWRAVHLSRTPLDPARLCQAAYLTTDRAADPTPSQVRRVTEILAQMARVGLVQVTENGEWTEGPGLTSTCVEVLQQERAELAQRVAAERAEYRAATATRWNVGRATALKAQRAKEVAWWDGLDPAERARRRTAKRQEFAGLSVLEQERRKAAWAARRLDAGEGEAARHDRWLDSQPMHQVVHESIERAAAYARLPYPVRRAKAEAWQRHRDRFGIRRGTPLATSRLEHAEFMPATAPDRDAAFLAADHEVGALFETA